MKKISKRFEELITRGKKLHKSVPSCEETHKSSRALSQELLSESVAWKLSTKNLLKQVYGIPSEYYKLYMEIFGRDSDESSYCKINFARVLGTLQSAKEEFDLGFTDSLTIFH